MAVQRPGAAALVTEKKTGPRRACQSSDVRLVMGCFQTSSVHMAADTFRNTHRLQSLGLSVKYIWPTDAHINTHTHTHTQTSFSADKLK